VECYNGYFFDILVTLMDLLPSLVTQITTYQTGHRMSGCIVGVMVGG